MLVEFPFCPRLETPALTLLRRIAHLLDLDNGPWVAGGVIRRIITHDDHDDYDIDVFFRDEDQRKAITPLLREIEKSWQKENGNQFTEHDSIFRCATKDDAGLKYPRCQKIIPLQLIKTRYYKNADELLADIDFTICQMVTDGKTVRCPHRSLNDLHERRLRISSTSEVRQTVRIFRYFTYGFEPDETVMKAAETSPANSYYDPETGFKAYDGIIDKITKMDLESPMVLSRISGLVIERDQGTGIAFLYGYPMPAPLAYLYIACPNMQRLITDKLRVMWSMKGLNILDLSNRGIIFPAQFFEEYRSAYRQEK